MFRESGYISPENDTIWSFLLHYEIRQRGALVKEMQRFSPSLYTLVLEGRGPRAIHPLWLSSFITFLSPLQKKEWT